jgi:hypothetical protein
MENIHYVKALQNIFDEIITPCFINYGFKKSGKQYYRNKPDLIDICSIQSSRDNSEIFASFTYNIKFAVPSFYNEIGYGKSKKLDCTVIDLRLGDVMLLQGEKNFYDYWYKIGDYDEINCFKEILSDRYDAKNLDEATKLIIDDLYNIVFPYFDKIKDINNLTDLIARNHFPGKANPLFRIKSYCAKRDIESAKEVISDLNENVYNKYKNEIEKYIKG